MSLSEASTVLGIKPNSVRSRFKAGKIKGERDNTGKIWVWIDPKTPANQRLSKTPLKKVATEGEIEALRGRIVAMQAELDVLRPKASEADRLAGELVGLKTLSEHLKDQLQQVDQQAEEWKAKADQEAQERRQLTAMLTAQRPPKTLWQRLTGR